MSAISVKAGQVLAKLDPVNELNALRSAQAAVVAAEGQLVQTEQCLRSPGASARQRLHDARQLRSGAAGAVAPRRSQVDDAEAQLANRAGPRQLHRTQGRRRRHDHGARCRAGRGRPGRADDRPAGPPDGRDAVFDVPAQVLRQAPADPEITVRLTDDPNVTAVGRVREVAPQADAQTRNFPVRVGINDPPASMLLGSTVTGTLVMDTGAGHGDPGDRADDVRTESGGLGRRSGGADGVAAQCRDRAP